MAEPTKRQRLIEALVARLEVIKGRTGSSSDVGRRIYLNQTPDLSEDDVDAIAVVTLEDAVTFQQEKILVMLPIEVHALVLVCGTDVNPWIRVEALVGDIKRAVELEDRTFGGLLPHPLQFQRAVTRALEREDGSNTIGASVGYEASIVEGWGEP